MKQNLKIFCLVYIVFTGVYSYDSHFIQGIYPTESLGIVIWVVVEAILEPRVGGGYP